MIQMIVFDMAGTTVNENNVVYKTLRQAIVAAGFPVSLDQVLLWGAGKDKLQAAKDILAEFTGKEQPESLAKDIHQQFLSQLTPAYTQQVIEPCAGAEALFQDLRERGIKVVLNTGYDRKTADLLLGKLGWENGKQIDLSVTADEVTRGRPHPDMIHLAMEKMGIPLSEAQTVAKIGDSIIDIEEGQEAGCGLSIGITTGAHTAEQMKTAQPDHILHSLSELIALL